MKKTEKRNLSLYVHIPFCKAKCNYCDFLSFEGCDYSIQKEYVAALCKELEAYRWISKDYVIRTIFFGGGTPSFIHQSFMEMILQKIRFIFEIDEYAEITIEGNPDSLTKERLLAYHKMGINRLSIGLQSANDHLLKTLGRVHNYDQFIAAYSNAREVGFQNINIDLMSGLPGETKESYVRTLAKIVELQPEHISAYSLIVEEGTPLYENEKLLELLPSEEIDRQLYAKTKILLQNCKYYRYEISNYAKYGYECRHNLVYWRGGEYLGIGLGASSYLNVCVKKKEWNKVRFRGIEDMETYINRFNYLEDFYEETYNDTDDDFILKEDGTTFHCPYERYHNFLRFLEEYYQDLQFLSDKDAMEEFMFLGLRCTDGISKKEFKERFLVEIEKIYGELINKYIEQGLLQEQGDRIFLSDSGIDVSNVIMAEFMI